MVRRNHSGRTWAFPFAGTGSAVVGMRYGEVVVAVIAVSA